MSFEELLERIERLEYHQSLLVRMAASSNNQFDKLIIERGLGKKEVQAFYKLCEVMSKELEDQKAEGFVNFHPLFEKFNKELHPNLQIKEVIHACVLQRIFLPLMDDFKRYL